MYEIYGKYYGTSYLSKKKNEFRLTAGGSYPDIDSKTTDGKDASGGWFISGKTRTDPFGIGYGIWVIGYSGPDVVREAEDFGMAWRSTNGLQWGMNCKVATPGGTLVAGGFTAWVSSIPNQGLYNYWLSKAFNRTIPLINPVFPFYKITEVKDDVTPFRFSIAKIINGYAYEAGSRGGYNDEFQWFKTSASHDSNGTYLEVYVLHPDGSEQKLGDVKAQADGVWEDYSVDNPQLGDEIQFRCGSEKQYGGSGRYGIIFFTHEINGYKIDDGT